MNTHQAVIVSAVRTPIGRANKGSLRNTRPEDLAALVLNNAVSDANISAEYLDDVYLGCAFPEAEQGMNIARLAALHAGFPETVSGVTINRLCASGLQSIAMAAASIMTDPSLIILAGGVESMSRVPMGGHHRSHHPDLAQTDAYIHMGITAEKVAQQYHISRHDQDQWAFESHQKAWDARQRGAFDHEITAIPLQDRSLFTHDELIRPHASLEQMQQLSSVFCEHGTVTAGNASPLSDGAAALLMMSAESASKFELQPLARVLGYSVSGVSPSLMGIGPVKAIPKVLNRLGLTLNEIDLIELNEAFAASTLAVIRELGLDTKKVNVNGGALALGHPLGCSGARLAVTAIHELRRRGGGKALISLCVGGGMGVAAVIEV